MTDTVLVSLIAAIASTISAIATLRGNRKLGAIKVEIDGRISELLESVKTENLATGHAAGVEAERNRPHDA
jgi:hypothetical protein